LAFSSFEHFAFTTLHLACVVMQRDRYFEHFAFTTLHLACVVMQRDRYFEHFAFTTLHLACVVMQGRMELPFRPPHFYVSAQLARLLARACFIRFT
jgi:hypothetical protein